MATKKDNYGNDAISQLKGAERVRKRPSVIFGSDNLEGCEHSVFEILSNSIDEAREGYGNVIEITRFKDMSIQVRDYGRGIPVDYNEKEKRFNWELVFCEMYAGGKYKNDEGGDYEFSLGLNGLGSCATQYASEYMDVIVDRDGYRYQLHFEKGENIGGLQKEKYNYKRTGTVQKWKPDLTVFTDIDIPLEFYQNMLRKQAIVNAGIRFVLRDEASGLKDEYLYENGIVDYVKEIAGEESISDILNFSSVSRGRDRDDKPEYKVKINVAMCFSNKNTLLEYYHNSSFLEHGGSPDKALRNASLFAVDKMLRERGKYTKDESKIIFQDIQDCLIFVSNSLSTSTSYANQTKKAINNRYIQEAFTDLLKKQLEIYFIENFNEGERVLNQILVNKRSRETAEKTRVKIKQNLTGKIDLANRVKKFVACRTNDILRRELYIVEGDSAMGSCKLGRNADFQAIIPVRGKILNCLKSDFHTIFKSEIIVDLLKVLGCGVEITSKFNKELNAFNLDNLRWNKIIICTDADVDGYQIRTLILAMIYRLVPTLISAGKVFIAESPLYEIQSDNKSYFAYNEPERQEIIDKLDKKYTIQRSKGLGENEPEMMWLTTMSPETRRLIQVLPGDFDEAGLKFDLLLGENLAGRKMHIQENGSMYMDMLDVN